MDLNGKDNYGWNALHVLCRFNSSEKLIDAMQLLIKHGIKAKSNGINALSLFHENPQCFKENENIKEIIKILHEAANSN
jgi:ankyrin repeat protein